MIDPELKLSQDMGRFFDDPLGFVMYAYNWSGDAALQLVKLPAPWCLHYESEFGPDRWACELLERIGDEVKAHGFDRRSPVPAIREAIASGHGIGKSAIVAWLVCWIMSTRPNAHGTITATTTAQLSSKTWAEVSKWNNRCVTGHWFDITTGKGAMAMRRKTAPDSWFCTAQTCDETNSESFAGQHAADSTSFYIFDEATGVPDIIWEVSEGGLTDGEPMWFAFGNPTRNTGKFAECFTKSRHRWRTHQIDSRTAQITNKKVLQQWIDDNGIDSDFCKVRIRGVFPDASSLQFIARTLVEGAQTRVVDQSRIVGRACAVGVDVARFGDDQSVIRTRVGRDARAIPAKQFRGLDTMQTAAKVVEHIEEMKMLGLVPTVFIDGGGVGGGVIDRVRQLGYAVIEVGFGDKATDARRYANKRAEMWGVMRDWLKIGAVDASDDLITDLIGVEYSFTPDERILLESKKNMKARGQPSPDDGDALALTFAHPVPEFPATPNNPAIPGTHKAAAKEHDPYASI